MEYKYLLEDKANKNEPIKDISMLSILCYHIQDNCKYPFLQFMVEKVPFCNNIIKEQITLPYIFLQNAFYNEISSNEISLLVLVKVKQSLDILGCNHSKVNEDMYKGIVFEKNSTPYALVNISDIDIYGLNFMRQTTSWFVLPSEIINIKKVCNIEVDDDLVHLFKHFLNLGLLINPTTNQYYIMPDAVYTGNEMKQAEFKSVFNNTKSKVYNTCGNYYYFYRNFEDAAKAGGHINRYALFVEGNMYLENNGLTDDDIEKLYPEPCIIMAYSGDKPDILVKNYESFVCLSYHKLNRFIENDKEQYVIS